MCCNRSNLSLILKILESHALELNNNYNPKNPNDSPLKAVLGIDDCNVNVILKTSEAFLEKLTLHQLESVEFSCQYHRCFRENESTLLKNAVVKVKSSVEERIKNLKMNKNIEFRHNKTNKKSKKN